MLQREKLSLKSQRNLQSHSSLEALSLNKLVDYFCSYRGQVHLTSCLILVMQEVSPFPSLAIMMMC